MKLSTIQDARVSESSGFALSSVDSTFLWTTDDESESPQLIGVEIKSGKTVATIRITGTTSKDSECLATYKSTLYLGDLGDNDLNRNDIGVLVMPEPGRGAHTFKPKRVPIKYSDGRHHNGESLFAHPKTGQLFIINKAEPSRMWSLPNPLPLDGRVVTTTLLPGTLVPYVSDACFNATGEFLLLRAKKQPFVYIYDLRVKGKMPLLSKIPTEKLDKPESITLAASGKAVLYGSEGAHSGIYIKELPTWAHPKAA